MRIGAAAIAFLMLFFSVACTSSEPSTEAEATSSASVSTPDPSSPEGEAILEPALADLEDQLGKPVKLEVKSLKVSEDWAFVWADMQEPDGQPFDYTGTPFEEDAANGVKSKGYAALLQDNAGVWTLVDSLIGPTDVGWEAWSDEYNVPAAILET